MDTVDDSTTLEQDATFAEPLRRVAYEAGMMLGLEATRDEQAYHRRRFSRQQYWFQGYGTLAGMRVSMYSGDEPDSAGNYKVQLNVGPGIGIDGLGREVLVHETYCINLREWLEAQTQAALMDGYDEDKGILWLKVCVRQKDCAVGQQPVLARKLNLSTDAVQPSRTADSVMLELVPESLPEEETVFQPWACHNAIANADKSLTDAPLPLSAAEQITVSGIDPETHPDAAAQLALQARLLFALDGTGVDTKDLHDQFDIAARLLLARIAITAPDINNVVVDPSLISINNLVRPFLVSPSQLAWLARQG